MDTLASMVSGDVLNPNGKQLVVKERWGVPCFLRQETWKLGLMKDRLDR
jgi:hypothetical protein